MRHTVAFTAVVALAMSPLVLGAATPGPVGQADFPPPVDRQSWVLPEWMTWDDYRPIPGVDWNDPARQPVRKIRAALILGDFEDREFIVTQPPGSDLLGLDGVHNPMLDAPVPAEELADWWVRFLVTEPSELNHFHSINEYWLEDSYGLIGVDADGFGPYRLDGKEHEYGLGGGDAGGGAAQCPSGDTCDGGFDEELLEKSLIDVTAGMVANGEDYDFRFMLHAGYDESGVWQEFGEMLFPTMDDVTEPFGSPDDSQPNWVDTRYIDWTSFAAGKAMWSHALPGLLSVQGESDGQSTYAHELSHIFGVLDNYNNPYSDPPVRSYTGTWAMLSRGTFNGPGGTHNRWQIPPTLGGTMGSHHMLRNKIRLGFMKPTEVLFLERETLALTGPQFATIHPRAYPLAPVTEDVGLHGIHLTFGEDRSVCEDPDAFDCDGGGYTSYTLEFVDRIGYDSFTTDSGVLLAKNKDVVDLAPFMWAIDAHPEDINRATPPAPNSDREVFDFVRPTRPDPGGPSTASSSTPTSISSVGGVSAASNPASQTVTVPTEPGESTTVTWTGLVPPGVQPDGECADDVTSDPHDITLEVPDGTYDDVQVQARFTIAGTGATAEVADLIVTVATPDGAISADNGFVGQGESVHIGDPVPAVYRVLACAFAVAAPQTYEGSLELTALARDEASPVTGEVVPISIGDARQLADALFHAGTGDGVVHEYVDDANRLHFYVLDTVRDDRGVATYRVAVRSLDGGGPWPRGIATGAVTGGQASPGRVATVVIPVTNTGGGAADLVRLAVTVPDGWEARLSHEVIEIAPGATVDVPVFVRVPIGASGDGEVALTATSETDPSATATASSTVDVVPAGSASPGNGRPPMPATGGGLTVAAILVVAAGAGLGRRLSRDAGG